MIETNWDKAELLSKMKLDMEGAKKKSDQYIQLSKEALSRLDIKAANEYMEYAQEWTAVASGIALTIASICI